MEAINLTVEEVDKMLDNFRQELLQNRHSGLTFTFKPKAEKAPEPIIVSFTGLAWLKMWSLVDNCYNEIGWHGLVTPSDDRKHFSVTDIIVYPQAVTSGNITVDETKYEPWHQLLNDEQYNTLRFQGHSHVNMACSPSGTDETLYNAMLQTIGNDEYYIFMILNKKGDMWIKIYDIRNNVIYDKNDIIILTENIGLKDWYKANYDTYVSFRTYSSTAATTTPATQTTTLSEEDKKKLTQTPKKDTTTTLDSLPNINTATLMEDLQYVDLTQEEHELIHAFICDPYYASDDPAVCNQITGIINRVNTQKKKKTKQKGKPGRPPKYKAPIECVGCTSYRWFNPTHLPCKYCDVVMSSQR